MKVFITLCVIAMVQYATAGMDTYGPSVRMSLEVEEEGKFEFSSVITQYFSREYGMGKLKVYSKVMSLGANVSSGRAYFGYVGECAEFMENSTTVMNVTELIQEVTANSTDIEPFELDLNIFEGFGARQFVGIVEGQKYCGEFDVEVTGMKMLRMKYQQCPTFDREGITKVIASQLDMEEGLVQLGAYGDDESGCGFVDVYLNSDFNSVDMLKKAYTAFGEKNKLGLFSPTETCMTDVKESFILEYMVKMFLTFSDEKEEPDMEPIKTCAGISTIMAKKYEIRVKQYDAIIKAYMKKYGGSFMDDEYDNMWQKQPEVTSTCNCSDYGSEAVQLYMQLKTISDYIGISLSNPQLAMKKQALSALLMEPYPDMEKVSQMTEQIRVLQEAQDRTFWDVNFGACMVAGRPDAYDKLDEIKEKLGSVAPNMIEAKADEILRGLFLDSILYSLDNIDQEREPSLSLLRRKLQLIFGVTSSCSSESERKRVLGYLMDMAESLPSEIQQLADMIENPNITAALMEMKDAVMADPKAAAAKIFYVMYAPSDVEEDSEMYQKAKALAMALKDNAQQIADKAREWAVAEKDNDKLMAVQVMLLTKADLDKGCDLTGLANRVRELTAPLEEPTFPDTPCSAANGQGRGPRQDYMGA